MVNEDDVVDIGVDGSLVEFYPNFEEYIREALREIPEIGARGEKRIRIGIAKDGSGVGAALIALVADKALKGMFNSEDDYAEMWARADQTPAGEITHTSTGGISGLIASAWAHINRGVRHRV